MFPTLLISILTVPLLADGVRGWSPNHHHHSQRELLKNLLAEHQHHQQLDVLELRRREHLLRLWDVSEPEDLPIPLIFPGTKWCGDGDIAANFSDLGVFAETDKCCRAHDHCPEWMAGFATNDTIHLHNKSPFTRCVCGCDDELRACLEEVDSPVSKAVGALFFDLLQIRCFREDYPIVNCTRYGGLLNRSCQEYVLDTSQPKLWQFFDNPVFNGSVAELDLNRW